MLINIKLLTKTGCSLCSKPVFILKRLKEHYPGSLRITSVNIDSKKEYESYLNKVPVILVNEKMICEMKVSERVIREEIEKFL